MKQKKTVLLVMLICFTSFINCTGIELKHGHDTTVEGDVPKVYVKEALKPHDLEAEEPHFVEDVLPESSSAHYSSKTIFNLEPFQIVRPSADHLRLEVVEENLKFLDEIDEPVSIIGILGPYHSGKSFLLNTILGDTKGFTVGPSTDSQTKGIWLRNTKMMGSDFSRVLLLDSEGFFGNNIDELYDAKIFAISTLLSSHLLYNSIKIIDQAAVEYLELLARRTQLFQFKLSHDVNQTNDADVKVEKTKVIELLQGMKFPTLTWVVRDFTQRLAGNSPSDWLNQFLAGRRDKSLENEEKKSNEVEINNIFNGINCITLTLPSTNEMAQLEDLSQVKHTQLIRQYRSEVWNLKESIIKHLYAKVTNEGKYTGRSIASLIKFLVYAANQNKLPELPSLWNSWIKIQGDNAAMEAIQSYEKTVSSWIDNEQPMFESQFVKSEEGEYARAIKFFKENLFNNEMVYKHGLEKLENNLKEKRTYLTELLKYKVSQYVANIKNKLITETNEKLKGLISPSDIISKFSEAQTDVFQHFVTNIEKYFSPSAFSQELEKFKNELTGMKTNLLDKSTENLRYHLNKAENAYLEQFHKFTEKFKFPVNPSKAYDSFKSHVEEFKKSFDEHITDPIWRTEELYKQKLSEVNTKIQGLYDEWTSRNEVVINQHGQEVFDKEIALYSEFIGNLTIPQDEPVLIRKCANYAITRLEDYDRELQEFNTSSSFLKMRKELQLFFHRKFEAMDKVNFMLWRQLSDDVFVGAKLRVEQNRCSFCLSNLLPFVYTSEARSIVERYMESNEYTANVSPLLKQELIDYWFANDLSEARYEVYRNFGILLAILIFLSIWIVKEMRQYFREQKVHHDKVGPSTTAQITVTKTTPTKNKQKSPKK